MPSITLANTLALSQRGSRPALLIAIIAAHAAIALAFIGIFQKKPRPDFKPSDLIATIEAVTPRLFDPPPAPPDTQLADEPPPLTTAVPEVSIPDDPPRIEVLPPAIGTVMDTPVRLVISPPTPASFIGLPPDPNRYYPPESVARGEQGAVIVRLCVNTDGSFDGPPRIAQSSGFARLDAAAVRWGSDVHQMRPATVRGQPIYSCKAERVVFKAR